MATVTLDDVRTTLEGQHSQVKQMIKAVKDSDGDAREDAFRQLTRTLAAHEAAEEVCVHAIAKQDLGRDADVVDDRVVEEEEATNVITDLEALGTDSPDFPAQFDELARSVIEHAEAEEHEELPKLEGRVDSVELERMKRALDRVPELAKKGGPLDDGAGFESALEAARAEFQTMG